MLFSFCLHHVASHQSFSSKPPVCKSWVTSMLAVNDFRIHWQFPTILWSHDKRENVRLVHKFPWFLMMVLPISITAASRWLWRGVVFFTQCDSMSLWVRKKSVGRSLILFLISRQPTHPPHRPCTACSRLGLMHWYWLLQLQPAVFGELPVPPGWFNVNNLRCSDPVVKVLNSKVLKHLQTTKPSTSTSLVSYSFVMFYPSSVSVEHLWIFGRLIHQDLHILLCLQDASPDGIEQFLRSLGATSNCQ